MSALTNSLLAEDQDFRNKVDSLIRKSAIAISGEEPNGITQAAINKRQILCQKIFFDYDRSIEKMFSKAVASLGTLSPSSSDNDIEFTINSIFSDMAGVTNLDLVV